MLMNSREKTIIRELAKEYMQFACSEKQQKAEQRMKAGNDLKIVRPTVLMDEIPWWELTGEEELICQCEDPKARGVETYLRRALYQKRHFCCDVLMKPYWCVTMKVDVSPLGIEEKEEENTALAHHYEDMMEDESALDLIMDPVFELRPDVDEANMNYYQELLGEAMPVRLMGHGYLYSAPWDDISFLRGVEPIYEDMYDRPEYLHQIMQKFVDRTTAKLDFIEAHSHVSSDPVELHCTPGSISGLAEDGWKATWYRGMAQPFTCISPAMFKEFELDYIKPVAERFAYTYYGCCEALDDRIALIKTISNLRKIGVSPWANVEVCAEQIGKDYVFARKPNPSHVAKNTDPEVVRKETEESVKACLKYGCPGEFVLKDITTISGDPKNLVIWAKTVSDVMDKYYGE